MTPALLLLAARQLLPWLTEDGRWEVEPVDGVPVIRVYADLDRWGDWTHRPTRTEGGPTERRAMWFGGALVVALVCSVPVAVGDA